jgi:hypothetical protein
LILYDPKFDIELDSEEEAVPRKNKIPQQNPAKLQQRKKKVKPVIDIDDNEDSSSTSHGEVASSTPLRHKRNQHKRNKRKHTDSS